MNESLVTMQQHADPRPRPRLPPLTDTLPVVLERTGHHTTPPIDTKEQLEDKVYVRDRNEFFYRMEKQGRIDQDWHNECMYRLRPGFPVTKRSRLIDSKIHRQITAHLPFEIVHIIECYLVNRINNPNIPKMRRCHGFSIPGTEPEYSAEWIQLDNLVLQMEKEADAKTCGQDDDLRQKISSDLKIIDIVGTMSDKAKLTTSLQFGDHVEVHLHRRIISIWYNGVSFCSNIQRSILDFPSIDWFNPNLSERAGCPVKIQLREHGYIATVVEKIHIYPNLLEPAEPRYAKEYDTRNGQVPPTRDVETKFDSLRLWRLRRQSEYACVEVPHNEDDWYLITRTSLDPNVTNLTGLHFMSGCLLSALFFNQKKNDYWNSSPEVLQFKYPQFDPWEMGYEMSVQVFALMSEHKITAHRLIVETFD